jgi:alpha-tubulin suppressor-like RCC1 family protein
MKNFLKAIQGLRPLSLAFKALCCFIFTLSIPIDGRAGFPPEIKMQPFVRQTNQTFLTNAVAPIGSDVKIEMVASGSLPLSFQWRFNGTDIPGETNTFLSLSNLNYDQTGFYSMNVRNDFGETNSAKLFLNVVQVMVWGDPFRNNVNMPVGLTNVIAVAAGGSHIAALKDDGTVKVWLGDSGWVYGPPTVTNVPASVTNIIAISAGRDHDLALRSNGTVVAWGWNSSGQTNVPPGLSNVISVAAGSYRSYAVKSDGSVVAWGSPLSPPNILSNIVKVSSATSHTLALQRDGSVIAWGSSGIATYDTNVSGLSNAIDIAAGSYGNLALRKDGTVWISPGSRILLTTRLSNHVAIAVDNFASMALKEDGTITSSGNFGKTPTPLLSNVTAIAAGGVQAEFGVALIGDGSPAITLHPYSQIVQKGDRVELHARAAGVQPMHYQWQLDEREIPGATNASLVITNMQGKDIGAYRMLASNSLGSVFSRTAEVTILSVNLTLPVALDATDLVWSSFSSTSKTVNVWFPQIRETHDGEDAAQSGGISHNQQSQLSTIVFGPGTLSFWWKVSSEAGYDFLKFSLDSEPSPRASISGETDWAQKKIFIPTGSHVLRWSYVKDQSVSAGYDAGWVDEVVFAPSVIRLHPLEFLEDGSVLLLSGNANGESFSSNELAAIEIQSSTNLTDWFPLPIAPVLTNGLIMFLHTNQGEIPIQFYRAVEH